ncbi:MAG: DUF1294 domain-containing protein [Eubacterium sp.]|jgi:uncharacterized membrane protein YsdA (DUF1294 family)|nr:DUF1294 domain-containing protein [Eubacterium sp.]
MLRAAIKSELIASANEQWEKIWKVIDTLLVEAQAVAFALPTSTFALLYLAAVSLFAVVLTFYDKHAAKKNIWRVKERTLFIFAALGGSAAILLTMLAIRHKTRHAKFMVGIPLILALQIAVIVLAFDSRLA